MHISLGFSAVCLLLLFQNSSYGIDFILAGAVSDHSIRINAKTASDSKRVFIQISEDYNFSKTRSSPPLASFSAANHRIVSFDFTELSPETRYYYRVIQDSDTSLTGRLQTFPEKAKSFSFAFSSSALEGVEHPVFETIREYRPLFFILNGGLFQHSIRENDALLYHQAYDRVLKGEAAARLYRDMPLVYTWQGNDYDGKNRGVKFKGRQAAREAYSRYFPHYPLSDTMPNPAIYQAFTVGRVRFLLTDCASAAGPPSKRGSLMGETQKKWFKEELKKSKSMYPVVFWISALPWMGDKKKSWWAYPEERTELSAYIDSLKLPGLCMLSGGETLALDTGLHENGKKGFPVFVAGALQAKKTSKLESVFNKGQYPGKGQFGIVRIEDIGGSRIQVRLEGRNSENKTRLSYSFDVNLELEDLETE